MMTNLALIERSTGHVVVQRLELAASYVSRLAGLQFRARLAAGQGLLLVPCASVHTMCMRFAIDVVWLDRQGRVLGVRRELRPWRMAVAPRGTHAVLELPPDTAWLRPGDVLAVLARGKTSQVPEALRFLQLVA